MSEIIETGAGGAAPAVGGAEPDLQSGGTGVPTGGAEPDLQSGGTGAQGSGAEPAAGGTAPAAQTFTQADIDAAVESAKKQWQAEADEAQRLSKLSAEERQKAELEIKLKKFEKDRAALDRQKLEYETGKQLASRNLPAEFAKQLTGANAEETLSNVNAFEKAFSSAIEAAVQRRLAGRTPSAGSSSGSGGSDMASVIAAAIKQGF